MACTSDGANNIEQGAFCKHLCLTLLSVCHTPEMFVSLLGYHTVLLQNFLLSVSCYALKQKKAFKSDQHRATAVHSFSACTTDTCIDEATLLLLVHEQTCVCCTEQHQSTAECTARRSCCDVTPCWSRCIPCASQSWQPASQGSPPGHCSQCPGGSPAVLPHCPAECSLCPSTPAPPTHFVTTLDKCITMLQSAMPC